MSNIELEITKLENNESKDKLSEEDDISVIITEHLKKVGRIDKENDKTTNLNVISYFNHDAKKRIRNKLAKSIEADINDIINWKYRYRKIGDYFGSMSQIITLSATVVAFSAGYLDEKMLSFIAGCLGSVSLALLKASAFSYKESSERNTQLNTLLEKYNFKEIPNIIDEK